LIKRSLYQSPDHPVPSAKAIRKQRDERERKNVSIRRCGDGIILLGAAYALRPGLATLLNNQHIQFHSARFLLLTRDLILNADTRNHVPVHFNLNIHSFSILSDDRSKASSKTISLHSAI
jgi:hypothetical protein